MGRRDFTPCGPDRLEDRAVLSGAAGPVVLSGLGFDLDLKLVHGDFEQYATGGNFALLRTSLAAHTAQLPFEKADGLGTAVNAALAQMQTDLAAGAPHPIATALHRVVAAIRADVQARIDAGSVVVR